MAFRSGFLFLAVLLLASAPTWADRIDSNHHGPSRDFVMPIHAFGVSFTSFTYPVADHRDWPFGHPWRGLWLGHMDFIDDGGTEGPDPGTPGDPISTPEPWTAALLGVGLIGLLGAAKLKSLVEG